MSESGTCSSTDSLDQVAKERRALWKMPRLVKSFPKNEREIKTAQTTESVTDVSSKGEAEGNLPSPTHGSSNGASEVENKEVPAFVTRTHWRSHKTRKARKLTRGKRITDSDFERESEHDVENDDADTRPKSDKGGAISD